MNNAIKRQNYFSIYSDPGLDLGQFLLSLKSRGMD